MKDRKMKSEISRQTDSQNTRHDLAKDDAPAETPRDNQNKTIRSTNLAKAIRARFAPLGGVELDIPPREPMREPPDFE